MSAGPIVRAMPMQKLDLKKVEHSLYSAPKGHAVAVDVPEESFLMLDGAGSPTSSNAFQDAIGALYSVAYSLKFAMKKADRGRDFAVMPLEALWWWDDPKRSFHEGPEKDWRWTLMIRQPDFVTARDVEAAIEDATLKTPLAAKVRFGRYREGRSLQIMHVGPYKDEWPTIQRLHADIETAGYVKSGKHHEIYLGDPRRSKPENLKTVVRQPVRTAGGSA